LGQPPIAAKSFFQAEEVTVKWSPRGDTALVLTQTSVDTTGDSYYGSTQLHLFLTADADVASSNSSIQVPLVKAGPVSSVEWCPDSTMKKSSTFLAISGKMPALAALYNGRTGEPIYIFGEQRKRKHLALGICCDFHFYVLYYIVIRFICFFALYPTVFGYYYNPRYGNK
jgi:uncharacterized protein with WD repeat